MNFNYKTTNEEFKVFFRSKNIFFIKNLFCQKLGRVHISLEIMIGHTGLFVVVIDTVENDRKQYVDAIVGRNALEIVFIIYKSQNQIEPLIFYRKSFVIGM